MGKYKFVMLLLVAIFKAEATKISLLKQTEGCMSKEKIDFYNFVFSSNLSGERLMTLISLFDDNVTKPTAYLEW